MVARTGKFPEEDKKLFYQEEDPYAVFIAHQFTRDDIALVEYVEKRVLTPIGLKLADSTGLQVWGF